jgi:hypothetical protein
MQPAEGVFFIHEAICADVSELPSLASRADSGDALAALGQRVAFLDRAVKLHTDGEELGMYPQIEEKLRHYGDGYLYDHQMERKRFAALRSTIASSEKDISERALCDIQCQARALAEHLHHHVEKENKLVVPMLCELFTPAEQGAHMGKMMASFAPADMAAVVPWLIRNLQPQRRVGYVTMLKNASPPERYSALAGFIRSGVAPEICAALPL